MNPSLHRHQPLSSAVAHDRLAGTVADHLDRVQRWEDSALSRLTPQQRCVSFGDHWIGLSSDDDFLFGRVATVEECAERERLAGARDEEVEESTLAVHDAHARGYRLGNVFSAERPHGHFESVHLCNILHRITATEFAVAHVFNFDVDAMRRAGILCRHPDGNHLVFTTSA